MRKPQPKLNLMPLLLQDVEDLAAKAKDRATITSFRGQLEVVVKDLSQVASEN
jgi:hypothetical protein